MNHFSASRGWDTPLCLSLIHILHEFGYLVAGIHGIIAAVVEKVTYIVLPEHLQQAAVVLSLIHI